MPTTMSTTAVRPLTYDTLLDMPDDGNRYEIIGGELFVTAAPAKPHQWALIRLAARLLDHAELNKLGEVYCAPVDVRLTPHDIVQPDILFLSWERVGFYQGSIVEGAPDLVVEILSPSTRNRDEGPKLALYASAGIREYWMVDPIARLVRLYLLSKSGSYRLIEPVDGIIRSTVLPGFEIDVNALFASLS